MVNKIIATLILPIYALSAAPNWVPAQKVEAFDRVMEDSRSLEAILRADYTIIACTFDTDTVKVTFKRHSLIGDIFLDLRAEKCEFKGNTFKIIQKPDGFPWKEVLITGVLSILAGAALGAGIGK